MRIEEIEKKLMDILRGYVGRGMTASRNSLLMDDLDLDSLDIAEIRMDVEKEFGVAFDKETADLVNIRKLRIGSAVAMIANVMNEKSKDMEVTRPIKTLDFVSPKGKPGIVGMVTKCDPANRTCSVEWINDVKDELYDSWWRSEELVRFDSLPAMITRRMAHPFGNNKDSDEIFFP